MTPGHRSIASWIVTGCKVSLNLPSELGDSWAVYAGSGGEVALYLPALEEWELQTWTLRGDGVTLRDRGSLWHSGQGECYNSTTEVTRTLHQSDCHEPLCTVVAVYLVLGQGGGSQQGLQKSR